VVLGAATAILIRREVSKSIGASLTIHAVGDWLFVVVGRGSRLAVFDIATRHLVGCFDLQSVLPPDLRRADRPADQYHFNSISFSAGRLFVLAHNLAEGSFALELPFDPAPGRLPVQSLRSIHRGLGHASHDIVFARGCVISMLPPMTAPRSMCAPVCERAISSSSPPQSASPKACG
jgi:hypothetical protein